MDPVLPSLDPAAGKTNFASGLLSSLSSLFGSDAATAGLFASFLAGDQPLPPAPPPPQIDTAPPASNTITTDNDSGDQSDGTAVIDTLQNLIGKLHRVVDRINRYENQSASGNSGSASGAGSNTNSNTANTSTTTNTTTSQTPAVSTNGTPPVTTSSTDPSDTGNDDGTDTGSSVATGLLSNIVADLTALMKLMEKKLAALQVAANSSTSTTTPVTQTSSTTGGTSAADPLTQLLALLQTLQQQLTASAGGDLSPASSSASLGTSSAGSANNGQSSPVPDALQDLAQLQKDLKDLMASLLNAGANTNTGTTSGSSGGTTTNTAPATPTDNMANTPTPNVTDKPSLALQDSLFDMFGGLFNNFNNVPPPSNFAPVNGNTLIASADAAGNPSPDTTPQDDSPLFSDGGSANLSGLSANLTALTGAADGSKAADPYAFASQLSALRAANGGTVGLPDAVEQVLLQINRGVKDGDDQMSIQLHPAELGKINVKLDISSDGQVRGTVVADNPSTLSMLHKDVRSLERALQEAGLRANPGSLQFSLSGQSGNSSGQTATNGNAGNGASDGSTSGEAETGALLDMPVADDEIYYLTPGRVNLKV